MNTGLDAYCLHAIFHRWAVMPETSVWVECVTNLIQQIYNFIQSLKCAPSLCPSLLLRISASLRHLFYNLVIDLMSINLISLLDVLPAESFLNVLLFQPFLAPVPTILRPVAGITFEMSSFCAYNFNISQFKHLCYPCTIVNKILAHVIWRSLNLNFIQI